MHRSHYGRPLRFVSCWLFSPTNSEDAVLKFLAGGTLVGLLPLPTPIMVRRYVRATWERRLRTSLFHITALLRELGLAWREQVQAHRGDAAVDDGAIVGRDLLEPFEPAGMVRYPNCLVHNSLRSASRVIAVVLKLNMVTHLFTPLTVQSTHPFSRRHEYTGAERAHWLTRSPHSLKTRQRTRQLCCP